MDSRYQLVTREQHAAKCWKRDSDYRFTAGANVAAIAADELAPASSALPLAFIMHEGQPALVAVLGLREGENNFVDASGRWLAPYVPATFRGYPFRLTRAGDGSIALCVHETSARVVTRGHKAIPFFDEEGGAHPETSRMLQFLLAAEKGIKRLQRPVEALQAEGILEPWPITLRDGAGERCIAGMLRVNETALNTLAADRFIALRDVGALPVAYAQLVSMHHLHKLSRLEGMSGNKKNGSQPAFQEGFFFDEHSRIHFT